MLPRWSLDDIRTERSRRSLRVFVEQAWPIVEPGTAFVPNWHIDVLCEHLEAVTKGDIRKILLNIPPGCMKSLICSVFWPAWEWATNPELRYLCWSYDETLSVRDSTKTHDIVQSNWYQRRWPHVQFRADANQKLKRETTAGGWRIASSFGGRGTGEHPDRIIVDDPHNTKQAQSDAERTAALERFDHTLSTRGAARGARFVVIMQRLHEKDLSGHILSRGDASEWVHISLPMRYEPLSAQVPSAAMRPNVDIRYAVGDLLWPALYDERKVDSLEKSMGSYAAAGQLQQRPAPLGGGLFQIGNFKACEAAPVDARRVRGWDKAGSNASGDWTAGVKIAEAGGKYYVEDARRDRLSSGARNMLMHKVAEMDGPSCYIRIEQEPGSGGKESAEISVRELAGYVVRTKPSTTDKVSRARPFAVQVEAGNVYLVRGPWNAEFLNELSIFPFGEFDDQVDAVSSAFNELALGQREVVATIQNDTRWQDQHFR